VSDLDDALLRPGRCFANVRFRALEGVEIERLLLPLCGADSSLIAPVLAAALPSGTRSATVASIYRAESELRTAARDGGPHGSV